MSLSRLSLMTHDVGFASEDTIYDNLIEISSSGARFSHLSYTSFIGLDPTDDIVQVGSWNERFFFLFLDLSNVISDDLSPLFGF